VIIKAEASAKSIELVGLASQNNPCTHLLNQLIWMYEKLSIPKKSHRFWQILETGWCLIMKFWTCISQRPCLLDQN